MGNEIVKAETSLAGTEQPKSLLQVIAQAVTDPRMDVEKMSKLLDLQERIVADERKTAFYAAMGRLAKVLPEIGKHGNVQIPGREDRKYARLEDIDRAIRPLISAEGLSLSFDTQETPKNIRIICRLAHEGGHSEVKQLDLPLDNSGSKNGAQAVASTVAYGRRILTKMFFNLIEGGEDLDGNSAEKITGEQAKDLQDCMEQLGMMPDTKAHARFLVYMQVGAISDILSRDHKKAVVALKAMPGNAGTK